MGETYVEGGIITMEIVSRGSNAIHEATHGYQIFNGTLEGGAKGLNKYKSADYLIDLEIAAYRRQFAFDPTSITIVVTNNGIQENRTLSYMGEPRTVSDINRLWVIGIRTSSDGFLYAKMIFPHLSDKQIKNVLDEEKKQK